MIEEKHKTHRNTSAGASANWTWFEVLLAKSVVTNVGHVSSRLYVRAVKVVEEAQLTKKLDCAVRDAAGWARV